MTEELTIHPGHPERTKVGTAWRQTTGEWHAHCWHMGTFRSGDGTAKGYTECCRCDGIKFGEDTDE